VQEAAKRVLNGETCHQIVRDWNDRGILTQTGKPWVHQTLRRILRSPTTAGLRSYNGTVVAEGTWPALIPRKTWESVCVSLMPTRDYQRRASRGYLLSGLVFCSKDNVTMTGHKGTGWKSAHGYECRATGCGRRISRDGLDAYITEGVLEALDTGGLSERMISAEGEGVSRVLRRYAEASSRMEELARMFASGDLSRAEWRAAQPVAAQKLTDAERQLAEHRVGLAVSGKGPTDLTLDWIFSEPRWRRDIIELIIERIDIAPASAPGKRFEPSRISVTWRA
jgi:site-specific DNA recombinase